MLKKCLVLVVFLVLVSLQSIGQTTGQADSVRNKVEIDKQTFTRDYNYKVLNHLKQYERSRTVSEQRRRLNELKHFEERLDYFLQYGLDTTQLYEDVRLAEYGKIRAMDGLQSSNNGLTSSGDLASSQSTLEEILQTLGEIKITLNERIREIEKYQTEFDSLVSDSNLFLIQTQNVNFTNVLTDYLLTNERMMNNFSRLLEVNEQLQKLLSRINFLSGQLQYGISEINQKRYKLAEHLLDKEQPYIWQQMTFDRSKAEVISRSYAKESDLLSYSLINNRVSLGFIFVLSLLCGYLIKRVSRSIVADGNTHIFNLNPVFHYPLMSTLFFALIICQFVYFNAPFVMQGVLWLGSWVLALWFIANKIAPFNNSKRALYFLLLYPFIFIEHLLLDPYPYESWLILGACLLIVGIGLYDWVVRKNITPDRIMYRMVLSFFMLVELGAAFAIVMGRYNAGKALMIAGYFGIMASLLLFWTKGVWFHALQIPINGLENRVQKRLYSNLKYLNTQSDYFINSLVYIAITVSFFRNFFLYNEMIEYIGTQVALVRHIGKYEYSWVSVFTFVGVIIVTIVITRIMALFFDDKLFEGSGGGQRRDIRNLGIVFKLVILSIGFLVAFAAAGVPMDKLTIILGSLGLGIGFGLQNIVSHILSGIIIAFEQPFVVNDQVEWNGVLGRITEVGLRSSKIAYLDGSEVVVPNTDLLNQRLVNWTHNHNMRRLELVVGLSYDSDLKATKLVLEQTLDQIELVRKHPEHQVFFHVFGDSSVECKLYFWIDVTDMLRARSEVILAVHKAFADKGISIPYPQIDVHNKEISSE